MDAAEVKQMNDQLELHNKMTELTTMSMDTQLRAAAKLLGYKRMPPSIREFCEDKYYLGNSTKGLYPFWLEELEKIFPTPIHTSTPILVLGGGIGIG